MILENDLNSQALYRGNKFEIDRLLFRGKNEELGIEITDLLLGILRTIIENPTSESNRKKAKKELIFELLEDEQNAKMLKNITLYQWNSSNALVTLDVSKYI
ncbi:MAG: hypothetical protein ACRC5C_01340, partial [Bacilli bacterium]